MKKTAIYPGTFDPITFGHLDIIKRAILVFDNIIIAVSNNLRKKTMFSLQERIELTKKTTLHLKNIKKIIGFNNLVANFAKKEKVNILIRGIRTIFDCEHEIKLFNINKKIYPNLESIFFLSSQETLFISSSAIKEIAKYQGNIKPYLPKESCHAVLKKIKIIYP